MRDLRVLYTPTNSVVHFPIMSLLQPLLSVPGTGSKLRGKSMLTNIVETHNG